MASKPHGDAHGHDDHGHDDHGDAAHAHHDDFDPEPARELSAGEPRTPVWMPILGAGLALAGAVYLFVSSEDGGSGSAASASASASASVAVVEAAPVAPSPRPPPQRNAGPGQRQPLVPSTGIEIDQEKIRQLRGRVPGANRPAQPPQ